MAQLSQGHDPIRQANYLRQALAQEKRPLGLFLCGGCSLAIRVHVNGAEVPLIPDIAGLTKVLDDRLIKSEQQKSYEIVLGHFKADKREEPNVEDLLSHIRSLRQVAGNDIVRGIAAKDLEALDRAICGFIVEAVDKTLPDSSTPYHKVAAWIGAIPRSYPVEIFTTNYDLLVEQALEENRVPYFDGFVGSRRTFFDSYAVEEDALPPRWARLWKLHGSVNWRQDGTGVVSRGEKVVGDERRVIHPSHLKYDESRRMPYVAMIDRLRLFLKQPSSVLIGCGYSFRDHHLNANLTEGLQGNSTAMTFALVHGRLEKYGNAVKIASTRANFSLLADDGAVIGTKTARWCEREGGEESAAVEWVPKEAAAAGGPKEGRFRLGDFARFGLFLEELIGAERSKEEPKNA